MKMEQTECSETLAYKIQTPGNYPEESLQHQECLLVVDSLHRILRDRTCIFVYTQCFKTSCSCFMKKREPTMGGAPEADLCFFVQRYHWLLYVRSQVRAAKGTHSCRCLRYSVMYQYWRAAVHRRYVWMKLEIRMHRIELVTWHQPNTCCDFACIRRSPSRVEGQLTVLATLRRNLVLLLRS